MLFRRRAAQDVEKEGRCVIEALGYGFRPLTFFFVREHESDMLLC